MNELAFGRSTASSALALNARHVAAIEVRSGPCAPRWATQRRSPR